MNGLVRVRPGPVRFHSDCKAFDTEHSRCKLKGCIVQAQELACKSLDLRFEDNHERFRCASCGLMGAELKTEWIRTEFMKDGTPVDVYKCQTCGALTALYQTDKAQRCRKLSDVEITHNC
jgi:DNA-directed RNA polymerase subunit RPC12/RpoP